MFPDIDPIMIFKYINDLFIEVEKSYPNYKTNSYFFTVDYVGNHPDATEAVRTWDSSPKFYRDT